MNDANNKNFFTGEQLQTLLQTLSRVLDLVQETKNSSAQLLQSKNIGFDEEDIENLKDEMAKICKASTYIMEIHGQVVFAYGLQV